MTTEASDPNQYRLETEFQGEYVIHTRPDLPNVEEPHDQEAIDMVQGRWTSGDVIGTGGYGVVLKQKNDSGRLRAVKRVSRGALSAKEAGLSWELRVLAKLKDASIPTISGWNLIQTKREGKKETNFIKASNVVCAVFWLV